MILLVSTGLLTTYLNTMFSLNKITHALLYKLNNININYLQEKMDLQVYDKKNHQKGRGVFLRLTLDKNCNND